MLYAKPKTQTYVLQFYFEIHIFLFVNMSSSRCVHEGCTNFANPLNYINHCNQHAKELFGIDPKDIKKCKYCKTIFPSLLSAKRGLFSGSGGWKYYQVNGQTVEVPSAYAPRDSSDYQNVAVGDYAIAINGAGCWLSNSAGVIAEIDEASDTYTIHMYQDCSGIYKMRRNKVVPLVPLPDTAEDVN